MPKPDHVEELDLLRSANAHLRAAQAASSILALSERLKLLAATQAACDAEARRLDDAIRVKYELGPQDRVNDVTGEIRRAPIELDAGEKA